MTDPQTIELEQVFAQMSQGDEQAFETLLQRSGSRVWGLCRAVLDDDMAARDAFLRAVSTMGAQGRFKSDHMGADRWIAVVARNEAVNTARADAPDRMTLPHVPPRPDHPIDIDRQDLADAFAGLEPAKAEALRRVWLNGDSYEDLSRYFQIPAGQVRGWVRGGIVALHDGAWDPSEEDDDDLVLLGAEYIMGVLTAAEAAAIEDLMALDPELQSVVAGWARSFARVSGMVEPEPVPLDLHRRAVASVQLAPAQAPAEPGGIWGIVQPALWGLVAAGIVMTGLLLLR